MKSILIIDDEKRLIKFYELLIRCRYTDVHIVHAYNGKEALEKARKQDYSVIISDIDMPIMNGIEFYEKLKAEKPTLAKKVGFISGCPHKAFSSFIDMQKCPCLAKPFKSQELYRLIDYLL